MGWFSYRIFLIEVGLNISPLCFPARVCKQRTPLWQQQIFIYEIAQAFWLFSGKFRFCADEDFGYWLDQPHFKFLSNSKNLYKIVARVFSGATAAAAGR